MIIELFNLKDKILFCDDNKIYKGTFLYLTYPFNNIKWMDKKDRVVINRLIQEANAKYINTPKYDRIWISRRNFNIDTYWNKRFITNIDAIADTLLKSNFTELHFGEKDIEFLKQIYLVNQASIIFSEPGSAFCNINFMKEDTKWMTLTSLKCNSFESVISVLSKMRNVKLIEYDKLIYDTTNKYYLDDPERTCNNPMKLSDINNFIEWFDNIISNKIK